MSHGFSQDFTSSLFRSSRYDNGSRGKCRDYNWGTTQSWSAWQSFSSVFIPAYQALTGLTTKNIILTEWASTETGGDKAAWITDAFQQITAGTFPQIAGLVWFNQQKETDWRIESSPAAQQAYYQANHSS